MFYKWRAIFGGMDVSYAKQLTELECENSILKRMLAGAHLDIHALREVLGSKRWPPQAKYEVWSKDFVSDGLATSRRIKCLTVADEFSH